MNPQVAGLRVAGAIFAFVSLLHLLRLITAVDVRVGGWEMPLWLNGVGLFVAGILSLWMWRLSATGH